MMTETDTRPAPSAAAVRTIATIEIKSLIPHRYPFLLVDTVEVVEENKRGIGTKCVTANEHFFEGHFPQQPIMPGVLIIEALAQTALVLLKASAEGPAKDKTAYFLGIDEAKFRNPVYPGSVLKLEIEVLKLGGRAGRFRGTARVGDKVAAEAEMSFVLGQKS